MRRGLLVQLKGILSHHIKSHQDVEIDVIDYLIYFLLAADTHMIRHKIVLFS